MRQKAYPKVESAYVIHNFVDNLWITIEISLNINSINVNKNVGNF